MAGRPVELFVPDLADATRWLQPTADYNDDVRDSFEWLAVAPADQSLYGHTNATRPGWIIGHGWFTPDPLTGTANSTCIDREEADLVESDDWPSWTIPGSCAYPQALTELWACLELCVLEPDVEGTPACDLCGVGGLTWSPVCLGGYEGDYCNITTTVDPTDLVPGGWTPQPLVVSESETNTRFTTDWLNPVRYDRFYETVVSPVTTLSSPTIAFLIIMNAIVKAAVNKNKLMI